MACFGFRLWQKMDSLWFRCEQAK